MQLQVFKATGNVEEAKKLYNHYAEVSEPWTSWRSIVLANKQPRKMFVQPNLFLEQDSTVTLKTYDASLVGLLQSWTDRFIEPQSLYDALLELTKTDAHHF